RPMCQDAGWRPLASIDPIAEPEYVAMYTVGIQYAPDGPDDELGERCKSATDKATCEAEVETGFGFEGVGSHVVTTDGDDVERYGTPERPIGEFLGEINTPEEALMVIWAQGYDINCAPGADGGAGVKKTSKGFEVITSRYTMDCDPIEKTSYRFLVRPDGSFVLLESGVISSEDGACIGRRPHGLLPPTAPMQPTGAAAHLATIARLEASAVLAFDALEVELMARGAPEALLEEVRVARADEVRHAVVMAAFAARAGAWVEPPAVSPTGARSWLDLALENAVEGCVRETYGAVVGEYQSLAAEDPAFRVAMRRIADDERRHATLSWKLFDWFDGFLSDAERESVRMAMIAAVGELHRSFEGDVAEDVRRRFGLPDHRAHDALVVALDGQLFAPVLAA
ncbi:MAG: hypothetical protein KC417_11010, partial [Myxococcales bacterium]|nr:hypothetical protein [Myxococcales bacterium]